MEACYSELVLATGCGSYFHEEGINSSPNDVPLDLQVFIALGILLCYIMGQQFGNGIGWPWLPGFGWPDLAGLVFGWPCLGRASSIYSCLVSFVFGSLPFLQAFAHVHTKKGKILVFLSANLQFAQPESEKLLYFIVQLLPCQRPVHVLLSRFYPDFILI